MNRLRSILVFSLLLIPAVAFAQATKCEEQLAVTNQLLQDIHQDRSRLQVEAASLKVQLSTLQIELQTLKTKEPKKDDAKARK